MKRMIIIFLLIAALSGCTKKAETTLQSYTACGCGCCGGDIPTETCLYHSRGDDLNAIIEKDTIAHQSSDCALMGCGKGIRYVYCDQES